VHLKDGGTVHAWGEFAEIEAPRKVVMTRRFDIIAIAFENARLGQPEVNLGIISSMAPSGWRGSWVSTEPRRSA
jgi:hypothetical protein